MNAAGGALVPSVTTRTFVRGLADNAAVLLADTRPSQAREAANAALAAAEADGDAAMAVYAAAVLGHALLQLDEADGAAAAAARMLEHIGPEGVPLMRARALALLASADVERGQVLAALDELAEALALVEEGVPGEPVHMAASSAVATVLLRLSMYEAAAELLRSVARSNVPAAAPHRLLAVRALTAVHLMWSAQLELLGEDAACEQLAATATCAVWMGRMAHDAGLPRLQRAAGAVEAYALERLGLSELAAVRARAALAPEPEPGWVFEWLAGRVALASAAWRAGDCDGVRHWVGQLEEDSPVARTGMGRALWEGLVSPALARLSAPPAQVGPAGTVHPAAGYLREIAVSGARLMWQEREARAADLRQRILRAELARRGEQTAQALLVDPLTGLGNRRRLEHELGGQAHRVALFVDIDSFKEVNDVHGHGAGDEVLRRLARVLRGCCRDEDVVVRYGGDEFVVLLDAGTAGAEELEAARRLGDRLLGQVRSTDWSDLVGDGRVTVSVGVGRGEVETALRRADSALLEAKRTGRDTLVVLSV